MRRFKVDTNSGSGEDKYLIFSIADSDADSNPVLGERIILVGDDGDGFEMEGNFAFGFIEEIEKDDWYIVPDFGTLVTF